MPRQKLTPEVPNARARTSVPTFIRESPPPPHLSIMVSVRAKYVIIAIFVENDNKIFTADLVPAAVDSYVRRWTINLVETQLETW